MSGPADTSQMSEKITRLGFEILDLIRSAELTHLEARTMLTALAVTYEQMIAIEDVTRASTRGEGVN